MGGCRQNHPNCDHLLDHHRAYSLRYGHYQSDLRHFCRPPSFRVRQTYRCRCSVNYLPMAVFHLQTVYSMVGCCLCSAVCCPYLKKNRPCWTECFLRLEDFHLGECRPYLEEYFEEACSLREDWLLEE